MVNIVGDGWAGNEEREREVEEEYVARVDIDEKGARSPPPLTGPWMTVWLKSPSRRGPPLR